ncbi:O-antigen ligase family protein [Micromonospora sp. NPDC023737]|uniref:O-antigen ligase family protein n=1 Tax=unclassified Micromonospora TaxID=2617518 RepID=UPI0033E29B3F
MLLTLLLVGSLLPTGGVPVVTLAAVGLLPIALATLVAGMPVLHRSAGLALLLAAVVAVPAYMTPPTTAYGADKLQAFLMLTVPTAATALVIRNRRDLTVWATVWVASGCVLALLTLVGDVDPSGRSVGAGDSNPIWLARGIGSPAVALLWLMVTRAIAMPIGLAVAGLLAAGLYATGSRGPVVALAIATLIVLTLSSASTRVGRAAGLALAAAVSLYVVLTFHLVPATSRLGAFLYDPRSELDESDRIELARPTLDLIAGTPRGVGLGSWAEHVPVAPYWYPHNLFLEVFAEAGWLPGGILVGTLIWAMLRLWRTTRVQPAAVLVLALLAFEVTCVSVSGDLNARSFFFILALGYGVGWWPAPTSHRTGRSARALPSAGSVSTTPPDQRALGVAREPHFPIRHDPSPLMK